MSTFDDAIEGVPPLPVLADRQRGLARSVGDLLKWRNGRDGMDAFRATTEQELRSINEKLDTLIKFAWGLLATLVVGITLALVQVYLSTHTGVHKP